MPDAPPSEPKVHPALLWLNARLKAPSLSTVLLLGIVGYLAYDRHVNSPVAVPHPVPSAVTVAAKAYLKAQVAVCSEMAKREEAGVLTADGRAQAAKELRMPAAKAFADAIEASPDKAAAWSEAATAMKGALK